MRGYYKMEFMVIHGDNYTKIFPNTSLRKIRGQWYKWFNLFVKLSGNPNKTQLELVNQIQSWHGLCAMTNMLRELDAFNNFMGRPKLPKEII